MSDSDTKPGASASAAQETKPKVEGAGTINLVVKDQNSGEVHFKVKPHTKFEKILSAYCAKKAVTLDAVRFLYDGNRVNAASTPADLDMEDGDTIDCVMEQTGGCSR